jgi:hypothetical protein
MSIAEVHQAQPDVVLIRLRREAHALVRMQLRSIQQIYLNI